MYFILLIVTLFLRLIAAFDSLELYGDGGLVACESTFLRKAQCIHVPLDMVTAVRLMK
jgi:hypothetical protein